MSVARVIVDVPSRETDRPFDYLIPPRLEGWVEVGSRVAVPFGGRTLQGIVVGLAEDASVDLKRLKELADVLDAVPPLSAELVELGEWMSRRWLCPLAISLQAMLPAALKGKTEKYITLARGAQWPADTLETYGDLKQALERHSPLKMSGLLQQFPDRADAIKKLLKAGLLEEAQKVEDRLSVRTVLTVFAPEPDALREGIAAIPARAAKQRETLEYLLAHPEPIAQQRLAEEVGTGTATIRALADKGLLELRQVEEDRDPYAGRNFPQSAPMRLTPAQAEAFAPIAGAVAERRHDVFLLHGVTGSGKTEIYLQAIQKCLDQDREAIVLVPEISLTPQMVERFKSRFGERVAVMHSRLSNGERYDEWRRIRDGRAQVAIGARSAIFAPFSRIGLIVIDEEHETSYKQEESPKYHARDVAVERARQHGAAVVLGSATPSLETYAAAIARGTAAAGARRAYAASAGEGTTALSASEDDAIRPVYVPLPERVGDRPLPGVTIVDMREELKLGNRAMFSGALADALRARLERGEQSVLLLNRRGYSTFVMCRSCGYTAQCPHCDIALTYHRGSQNLRCHYCGYAEREPSVCPSCQSPHIRFFGTGTQKVEEALSQTFPGIRVIRMDVDTTSEKGSHEKWLTQFRERRADVLLGTQMVAKGLDFPYVTLVGVLAADSALKLPDFRAPERTFQLLTQVAGRAGRHELPGEVIIQTYEPEHPSVALVRHHDYAAFTEQELGHRRKLGYPPFGRLISITLSHEQAPALIAMGQSFASKLRERASAAGLTGSNAYGAPNALEVLGPVASPIPRLKDRYRFQCMIKYRGDVDALGWTAQALQELAEAAKRTGAQISVDVDPQMML
ncbi:primosomal protein N' [Cohnella lubricantis]|uniref:Replication restart protein PriA n=1 Tax=Cohnella lubricantis TaxID=2163172 RepID=A0A841TD99_9BACL|nr:primosomal protein N' [Cohnella lubricantis]MBB6677210.1 primosomal protein N' [Cohnella lubricantis]MBP2116980.1 primosomal protein N' (replication factor Y) [Cohnella lubricantis]